MAQTSIPARTAVTRSTALGALAEPVSSRLLAHFNTLYPCSELGEHELNITYLAWLWHNGYVTVDHDGQPWFEESETGMSPTQFEISFEAGEGEAGGVNLALTREFYDLDAIAAILSERA